MHLHRDRRSIGLYIGRLWLSVQLYVLGLSVSYLPARKMFSLIIGPFSLAYPARKRKT